MAEKMTYRQAGVDIEAKEAAIAKIKRMVGGSQSEQVLRGIGAFGGLYRPNLKGISEPVLVSSADGIGTKVMLANAVGRFKNLGHDLVNHCVNDIAVMGAIPLFFLDYLAFGRFREEVALEVVAGFVEACSANGCALLGGETAEMPDLYEVNDFDVAGFIVGLVDEKSIYDNQTIQPGDCLVGIASNGLHTNGYSLVRKLFFARDYERCSERVDKEEEPLIDLLLRPHLTYLPVIKALKQIRLKGMAHITGGGIPGNLIRILPESVAAWVQWGSWVVPPLFMHIQAEGTIERSEMQRVFNLGIGLIVVCAPDQRDQVLEVVVRTGYSGWQIGEIRSGTRGVFFD
ncbi:phosphoribosylformylglycinamidine cyclo-ligase [bacterium]|nr:phosphoribosylformylglycinamidine cyclo-ligase [bacterium]